VHQASALRRVLTLSMSMGKVAAWRRRGGTRAAPRALALRPRHEQRGVEEAMLDEAMLLYAQVPAT
jgi:hypothetical protein